MGNERLKNVENLKFERERDVVWLYCNLGMVDLGLEIAAESGRNRKSDGNCFPAIIQYSAARKHTRVRKRKRKKFVSRKKRLRVCSRPARTFWCRLRVVAIVVSGSYLYYIIIIIIYFNVWL